MDKKNPFSWIKKAAISLLLLWLILHTIWLLLDHTPPQADQNFYVNGAVNILANWHQSWGTFLNNLMDVTQTKMRPPGASLVIAPWLALFHNQLNRAVLSTLPWLMAMFGVLYMIGQRLWNPVAGWIACVYMLSLPLLYEARIDPEFYFMTLLPAALGCCLYFWTDSWIRKAWWLAMGLITALAMLIKWVFAAYLLGPVLMIGFSLIRQSHGSISSKKRDLYIAEQCILALPIVFAFLWWYWPNREPLIQAFQQVSQARTFTPFKTGWNWTVPFYYPLQYLQQNKIVPFLFAIPGIVIALHPPFFCRLLRLSTLNDFQVYAVRLFLSSILGFLLIFSIHYQNIPVKYGFALLPMVSILGTYWIFLIRNKVLQSALLVFLLLYGLFCTFWIHFAYSSWMGNTQLPRRVQIKPHSYFQLYAIPISRPPHAQQWPYHAIAETVRQLEPPGSKGFITVLPNLYYFNWRNCDTALRLEGLPFHCGSLEPSKGLLHLVNARYILTSRGQVSRLLAPDFSENIYDRMAVYCNRFLDTAPPWFWNHYRMVGRFQMPYGLPELQLFRREKPLPDQTVAGWCNFWLSNSHDALSSWDQIMALWESRNKPTYQARAKTMRNALHSVNEAAFLSSHPVIENATSLFPYEQLQKGLLYLEWEKPAQGKKWLDRCIQTQSACSWYAAYTMGSFFIEHNQLAQAEIYLKQAWQLQRHQPAILEKLGLLSQKQSLPTEEKIYRSLYNETVQLLSNNRRPIVYQNIANRLHHAGWNTDALWYAYRGFIVGLARYWNNIPLYRILDHTGLPWLDYETLTLPFTPNTLRQPFMANQAIVLAAGQSYVFPFLNLDGGTYRLSWKHHIPSSPVQLTFSLDESRLDTIRLETPARGDFTFESPAWGDRLRIDCTQGTIEMDTIRLQRIQVIIPFVDGDGNLQIKGIGYHSEQYDPQEGFSFETDSDWVRLNFAQQTDTHAWNTISIEGQEIFSDSAFITYIVRGDEKTPHELKFPCSMKEDAHSGSARISIPEEIRSYPFLLGFRIRINNLPPAPRRVVKKVALLR